MWAHFFGSYIENSYSPRRSAIASAATKAGRSARPNAPTRTTGGPPERLDSTSSPTMDVMRVEGEDMQQEDFTKDAGWCEVRRRNIKKTSEGSSGPTRTMPRDAAALTRAPGDSKWKSERTIRRIIKASRLPHLPTEDYKHRQARIYHCLRNAAGVSREAAEADSICINYKQNIIVVRTPSEEQSRRYGAIRKIHVGEQDHEASAYSAAAENTRWERRRREEAEAERFDSINDYNKRAGESTGKNTYASEGQRTEGSPPELCGGNRDAETWAQVSWARAVSGSAAPLTGAELISGETPLYKRRAKEEAEGMFQEMFTGQQQQFIQMRADLQQQITKMRAEMSQRFDVIEDSSEASKAQKARKEPKDQICNGYYQDTQVHRQNSYEIYARYT
ncbi:hypothetical protein HPB49_021796 [Dermacentor silvarum]|uniref:Uncharacterized protein n=1 Tax=Dermacentor silvarum TaxID=543639 RepID=A0ACB8CHQ5_DERSI|nr:hypothetical protein HPB49_021796 [Dermacentor silvarum]